MKRVDGTPASAGPGGTASASAAQSGAGMGGPAPMRADARRNRQLLLAAALATFTESGADDTSLEEIARRAGVGIGTLYRHFPSRQSLLESVYRDQVEVLCARAGPLREEEPAGSALTAWLRALVGFGLTKRSLMSHLLAGPGMDTPVFTTCRADIMHAAGDLLTRAQDAGQARPDIDASDLVRITHAVVAATERLPEPGKEADRLLDIMLGGVLTPRP
jgi:AcrR family transcriptional regulator